MNILKTITLAALLSILLSVSNGASAKPTKLLLSNFEGQPRVWRSGENVSEKSQAVISGDQAHSGKYSVKLTYTFESKPNLLNYFGFGMAAQFMGRPTEFSAWVYGDGSAQPMRLRVNDAGGEVFQYWMPDITWTGWKQVTIPLEKDQVHWSGNGDGKWDLPLHFESVLVDSAKEPFDGVLYFDDLSYTSEVEPVDQVTVRLETDAFGGIYWGGEKKKAPRLTVTSANPESPVAGTANVRVTGPRGIVVLDQNQGFKLNPGETQRFHLSLPKDREGLFRVQATLVIEGTKRDFTDTFAYFAHPHNSALDPNSFFGVCGHFGQSKGDIPRSFDLMSKAGAKWFRDEIYWGGCEKVKGQITMPEWADRFMQPAVKHGVIPFILFDYSSDFYDGGNSPTSPEAQEAFGKYCYELVRHFKDICKHWEVYNEPNIGFWRPKPDPEAYARLLKISYQQAKLADPTCTVVGVCTAGTDLHYIEEVLKRGGVDYMDALSIHPYRYPGSPEKTNFVREVTSAHELMKKYGGGDKKIWLTEIGWPTHKVPGGVTEEMSGNYLIRMHVQAMALPFVERIIWYDFQDDGLDQKYNEHNFGILRWETFAPKQNYVAYKMMTEHLTGAKFLRRLLPLDEKDQRYCYEFERRGRRTFVAWSDGGAGTLALSLKAKQVKLTWADAHRESRPLLDGNLTLALDDRPVFITGNLRGAALAQASIGIDRLRPMAAGEKAELRITSKRAKDLKLSFDTSLVDGEVQRSQKDPGLFSFRIRQDAEPTTTALTARTTDAAGKEIASAGASLEIVQPVSISLGTPQDRGEGIDVPLVLENTREVELQGAEIEIGAAPGVTVRCDRSPLNLSPRGNSVRRATLGFGSTTPGATCPLEVRVRTATGAEAAATFKLGIWNVPRAKSRPTIDGRGSEWSQVTPALLGARREDFWTLRPGAWVGAEDLSAKVRMRWDEVALYVLVEATDDKHVQPNHGSEVWQSDNVQLALDYGFAGGEAAKAGQPISYPEIGLTRTDSGDEVYRWLWNEKANPSVAFRSSREGNHTTYEAAIPWQEINARTPRPGDLAGFALILNEDDGEGRDGWLELYSGIGYGKDARKFGWVRFVG
ncbi:MAG: hypothetical protein HY318_04135 [Armatimonadetes bacterium]|nr:hypothetical protein [Armatimonadota bacterium]